MDAIYRHVAACNNAVVPGPRVPVLIHGACVGYLDPALLAEVVRHGAALRDGAVTVGAQHLPRIARALATAGRFRWRDEAFDVRADPDGTVLSTIDRGALPAFGIQAAGVHLNALVAGAGGWSLWVARRAANKQLDPGKLDHLVAGGVPAGFTPAEALAKEAEEEAGLPARLLHDVAEVTTIDYAMDRPEGLRRDRLYCYDVVLPADFVPQPNDGEVEAFELWPLPEVVARVRDTDEFKFNVNLVLIDLFERRGLLTRADRP